MTQAVFSPYITHQKRIISPFLTGSKTVLDFGCGDMELDRMLAAVHPNLTITGIDVVPFQTPVHKRLRFRLYKGNILPFSDRSFDMVYAYHVLHHTDDPALSLRECMRVSKHRVVIVEPVLRHPLEKFGFAMMDWATNIWKKELVPLPYHVHTFAFWKQEIHTLHIRSATIRHVGVLPRFFPIGETLLFDLEKRI